MIDEVIVITTDHLYLWRNLVTTQTLTQL